MTTPSLPTTRDHTPPSASAPGRSGVLPAVAALVYLATLFATPPDGPAVETATASQIRSYFETNAGALRVQAFTLALAGAAIVTFACALASLLTTRTRTPSGPPADQARPGDVAHGQTLGALPAMTVAGGALIAVWHWLTAAAESSTAVQALDGTPLSTVDDTVLRSWYAGTNSTHLYGDISMVAITLLLTATCLGALRTRLLPRWVAALGLLAAAAGAVGTAGVTLAVPALATVWFGGLFGWTLWLPCVAITLIIRARRSAH